MAQTDQEFNKNKLIGDTAESIVAFLVKSMPEWRIIQYGMEAHINELKQLLKNNNKDENSRKIRCMPDFIAVNTKTNEVLIIDVKYRSFIEKRKEGKLIFGFSYHQIEDYIQYWNSAKLLIIHKDSPHFYVVDINDIDVKKHYLGRQPPKNNRVFENWDFMSIKKNLSDIFPTLTEDNIQLATKNIPKLVEKEK